MDKTLLHHYGKAIYEYAQDNKKLDVIYDDINYVNEVIKNNPEYVKFLSAPTIPFDDKKVLTSKIFEKDLDSSLYAFLLIMIRKDSMHYFNQIYKSFLHYYNEYKGIIEGKVFTALLLEEKQIKKLESILSKKEKKTVSLEQFEDKKLVGGIRIYLDNKVYDYSLEKKIDTIKEQLLK